MNFPKASRCLDIPLNNVFAIFSVSEELSEHPPLRPNLGQTLALEKAASPRIIRACRRAKRDLITPRFRKSALSNFIGYFFFPINTLLESLHQKRIPTCWILHGAFLNHEISPASLLIVCFKLQHRILRRFINISFQPKSS